MQAKAFEATLNIEIEPELPAVLADQVQIEQLLLNLIRNGFEAMKQSTTPRQLLLGARQDAEARVRVEVIDHGRGLQHGNDQWPLGTLLFRQGKMDGMGLSICRSIIENHSGHLGPNRHQKVAPNSALRRPAHKGVPMLNVPKALVCVVDDDAMVRQSLGMLLETPGLALRHLPDCRRSFLESSEMTQCECLILDVRMPGISGTVLQDILSERAAYLPIIFISGHGDIPLAVEVGCAKAPSISCKNLSMSRYCSTGYKKPSPSAVNDRLSNAGNRRLIHDWPA
ncbi:MAG: response regulator [Dechloromonas sp.]|uniref:histidine kinase n=1 Tax=Candidatus Dechloromonas phosphorivorans TaxID=2899244 RepID=A0A935MZC2_9RHOO|nr:response regulator [Candidatus Dechloromonas phosphorivorans]